MKKRKGGEDVLILPAIKDGSGGGKMLKARRCFETAVDRGDKYTLILQKKQQNADSLTFALTGSWSRVQMYRLDFKDYAYVHILNASTPWEEHEEYLRGLGFKW